MIDTGLSFALLWEIGNHLITELANPWGWGYDPLDLFWFLRK